MPIKINDKRTIYFTIGIQVLLTHHVKTPLMEGLRLIRKRKLRRGISSVIKAYRNFQRIPEPTLDNTWHPNTANILNMRDWAWSLLWWTPPKVRKIIRTGFNFWAVIYDMDPPWRFVMDRTREKAGELDWHWYNYQINLIKLKRWFAGRWNDPLRVGAVNAAFNAAIIITLLFLFVVLDAKRFYDWQEWQPADFGGEFTDYPWWSE